MRYSLNATRSLLFVLVCALPVITFAQPKVPQTVADHLALAKSYQEKAAAYRREAAYHRAMAEEYRKSVPAPPKIRGENPWAKKMEAHCLTIAADAERMAKDADTAAQFHTLRARELQGK